MKMKGHQYYYSEKSNDTSTSRVQVDVDKVQVSVETKCPICQEHHNIWGLTDAFDLRIKEDILILTVRALSSDTRFWKDAFKIKYCPFCGRPLNEEDN
ncbi:hypothetical protein HCY83_05140 [Limosilactobacillus fermentum]